MVSFATSSNIRCTFTNMQLTGAMDVETARHGTWTVVLGTSAVSEQNVSMLQF